MLKFNFPSRSSRINGIKYVSTFVYHNLQYNKYLSSLPLRAYIITPDNISIDEEGYSVSQVIYAVEG